MRFPIDREVDSRHAVEWIGHVRVESKRSRRCDFGLERGHPLAVPEDDNTIAIGLAWLGRRIVEEKGPVGPAHCGAVIRLVAASWPYWARVVVVEPRVPFRVPLRQLGLFVVA